MMEKVHFFSNDQIAKVAEKSFSYHKKRIRERLPEADIQHIGSTALPQSLTKGDLDIQVRVSGNQFPIAVQVLSQLYDLNNGSTNTESFRAFKDESTNPPLGVQLTVIGSELDFFWKFRDTLLSNEKYRNEYDRLKRSFDGKSMVEYRKAKHEFIENIMVTPEYKRIASQRHVKQKK